MVGIFNSSGAFDGGYSYSPYGEKRSSAATPSVISNKLQYIGERLDADGVYKLGARYYDTSLGRFTQTDPTGQDKYPYAYAACNPINNIDPAGQMPCGVAFTIGLAGVGGVIAAVATAPVTLGG